MKNKYRSLDQLLEEYLQNPDFAISFLNQALADEDIEAFKLSLKDVIRVHGNITQLAKKAGISRGTIYNIMNEKGEIEIGTVLKIIHALGFSLTLNKKEEDAA